MPAVDHERFVGFDENQSFNGIRDILLELGARRGNLVTVLVGESEADYFFEGLFIGNPQ
jgi:hypothetical protein